MWVLASDSGSGWARPSLSAFALCALAPKTLDRELNRGQFILVCSQFNRYRWRSRRSWCGCFRFGLRVGLKRFPDSDSHPAQKLSAARVASRAKVNIRCVAGVISGLCLPVPGWEMSLNRGRRVSRRNWIHFYGHRKRTTRYHSRVPFRTVRQHF